MENIKQQIEGIYQPQSDGQAEVFPQIFIREYMPDLATGTGVVQPAQIFAVPQPNEFGVISESSWNVFVEEFMALSGLDEAMKVEEGFNIEDQEIKDLLFLVFEHTYQTKRFPLGLRDETQHTEFHHALRVATINGREFETGVKGIISGLLHNYLDVSDNPGEFAIRAEKLKQILGDDRAGEMVRQAKWMDFIESIGDITHLTSIIVQNGDNITTTQDLYAVDPYQTARATNALPRAAKALDEILRINSFGMNSGAINRTIDEVKVLISQANDNNLEPKRMHEILGSIFIKTQLLMSTGSGELPMLVMAANLVDDLRYPREADDGIDSIHRPISNPYAIAYEGNGRFAGQENLPISVKMRNAYLTAKWFYSPCLDIHDARALRVVKELVAAWDYPHEFKNAYYAVQQLRCEEYDQFFDSRSNYMSLVTDRIASYWESQVASNGKKYKVVSPKEFEARFIQNTRRAGSQEKALKNVHEYLKPHEILVIRQRRKSLGSILEKLEDDKGSYREYITKYWPDVEYGSIEYFKIAINLIQDINAATIVTADTQYPYRDYADIGEEERRDFAKLAIRQTAYHLVNEPTNSMRIRPFLGVREDKYRPGGDNVPELAVRVYDRTKKPNSDNYFSASFCFEGEMGMDGKGNTRWPMRGEVMFQDFGSWFNALCFKAGHPRYKLQHKGIIPANLAEDLDEAMLLAVIT